MVSPNKNPQGLKGSIWSKMSFTMARSGMERNIPGIPHKAFPTITAINDVVIVYQLDEIIDCQYIEGIPG
jgi:hypothetical protein